MARQQTKIANISASTNSNIDQVVSKVTATLSVPSNVQTEFFTAVEGITNVQSRRRLQSTCASHSFETNQAGVTSLMTAMVSGPTSLLSKLQAEYSGYGSDLQSILVAICGTDHTFSIKITSTTTAYIPCDPGDSTCANPVVQEYANFPLVNAAFAPPSPPMPPSPPPTPPPPSPPPAPSPPPPRPPPAASSCGCDAYLDGVTESTLAADVCVKRFSVGNFARTQCRPMHGQCPSDHQACYVLLTPWEEAACSDSPGRWATRKCARKSSKGKCGKKRIRRLCQRTCGACPVAVR